jgi:hypothetical protein
MLRDVWRHPTPPGEFIDQPEVWFAETPGAIRARVNHLPNADHCPGNVRHPVPGGRRQDCHT